MTSVERILEYSHLESEAALEAESDPPEGDWPGQGRVEFRSVTVRYDSEEERPAALNNVSFDIKAAEKVS